MTTKLSEYVKLSRSAPSLVDNQVVLDENGISKKGFWEGFAMFIRLDSATRKIKNQEAISDFCMSLGQRFGNDRFGKEFKQAAWLQLRDRYEKGQNLRVRDVRKILGLASSGPVIGDGKNHSEVRDAMTLCAPAESYTSVIEKLRNRQITLQMMNDCSLPNEEAVSINYLLTKTGYKAANELLGIMGEKNQKVDGAQTAELSDLTIKQQAMSVLVENSLRGLRKLPKLEERACKLVINYDDKILSKYKPGRSIKSDVFLGAHKLENKENIEVAGDRYAIFSIEAITGKEVGFFANNPEMQQCLFAPGAEFTVQNIQKQDQRYLVSLRETHSATSRLGS